MKQVIGWSLIVVALCILSPFVVAACLALAELPNIIYGAWVEVLR